MIVETPRLLLREFVEADWPAVLAYQSEPRYLTYYNRWRLARRLWRLAMKISTQA